MRIITGSGRLRRVHIDIPCAEIVKRSSIPEQNLVGGIICSILGIKNPPETVLAA